ncbi:MAG: hypothetical protein MRY83_16800 [Flavobacteriales bacterium]|nr:hypothetical protein [Flavobacteriales bacterium]
MSGSRIYFRLSIAIFTISVGISLFSQLGSNVLWNDEAYTAEFAKRCLEFGYPIADDGKNLLYQGPVAEGEPLLVNQRYNANVELGWLNYYVLVPFVAISQNCDTIYWKSFWARFPNALIGFGALISLMLLGLKCFSSYKRKTVFILLFLLVYSCSFTTILHLRDLRYYALQIFLIAIFLNNLLTLWNNWEKKKSTLKVNIWLVILFQLMFHNLFPSFFVAIGTVVFLLLYSKWRLGVSNNLLIKRVGVLLISVLLVVPFLFFYKVIGVWNEVNETSFSKNFISMISYLLKYEMLLFWFLSLIWFARSTENRMSVIVVITNVFILFYVGLICFSPIPELFTRYYLPVVVLMNFSLVLCVLCFAFSHIRFKRVYSVGFLVLILISLFITFKEKNILDKNYRTTKARHILNCWKGLFVSYKGPVDHLVTFIEEKGMKDFNIATNYAEATWMYYFKAKVLIGFKKIRFEEDLKFQADLVCFRKMWTEVPTRYFYYFLEKGRYRTVKFPVLDYYVNNIPQIDAVPHHLYRSYEEHDETKQAAIQVLN